MENKEIKDKSVSNMVERLINEHWEGALDNLFANLRENDVLKAFEANLKKRYKLD